MKVNRELIKKLKELYKDISVERIGEYILIIKTKKENLLALLNFLKAEEFIQLKVISCVDWIEENEFELVYHISSLENPLHIIVKVRIERGNPEFETIISIFENAQVYEKEIHELFGVKFKGNPNLSPLFLENWQSIPPFRKDFDTREYVKEVFDKIPNVEGKNEKS